MDSGGKKSSVSLVYAVCNLDIGMCLGLLLHQDIGASGVN